MLFFSVCKFSRNIRVGIWMPGIVYTFGEPSGEGPRQADMHLTGVGVCQGVLVSYIGHIRTNTAKWTDERVRLAGEAISGCLAVKMLGAPRNSARSVLPDPAACLAV